MITRHSLCIAVPSASSLAPWYLAPTLSTTRQSPYHITKVPLDKSMPTPTASSSKNKPPKTDNGSLTSIVSTLFRASLGSTAEGVKDEDLDKHVADLLLKDAKEKEAKWKLEGVKAYRDSDEYVSRLFTFLIWYECNELIIRRFLHDIYGFLVNLRISKGGLRTSAS